MSLRIAMLAGTLAFSANVASADYTLTILHTNDFHARFEPITRFDSTCGKKDADEGNCFGGSARLVTAVSDARKRNNNTLLLDGGDQFQGTLFYTYYKGKAAAELMNQLGYDAMTVGNHEFDDGPDVLRGFVDSVKFPVLMSNADLSAEPKLKDVIKKSIIIERGGEKLGLIGLTPIDTPDISSPGKNIVFTDPVPAVQAEVDKLTAQGINKIIVVSHSGYHVDRVVAAKTTGVDIIVGGHTNTLLSNKHKGAVDAYPKMVGETAIVQAYAYGKFLGELNVTFDDAGKIASAAGDLQLLDKDVAEDPATAARISELAKPLDEIRNKVVAQSADAIDGSRETCRAVECPMGNLVADAMLERVKGQGVTIAITNGGGLRASIDAGEVTMGEVLTVLPFLNTLSTFQIKGADMIAALENGVSAVEEGNGKFPQVAGLKFTWDSSVAGGAGRVKEVSVMDGGKWAAIDPEKVYSVVTNNFVRNGGDGYKMFATNAIDPYDFGPGLEDVVADYLAKSGPYKPYTDGRIVKK